MTAALVEGLAGPVTFAQYMRLALYHPEHGYYATRAPGAGRAGSGFHTSPSLGPWFGRLFARAAEGMREALGRPDELTVVEVGAGRGDLAAATLETPSLEGRLRWVIVEPFDAIEGMQRERLGPLGDAVTWCHELDEVPPVSGCVLANEVLDNLPVHLLERAGDEAVEIYVAKEDGRLKQAPGPLSDPGLGARAAAALPHLEPGDRFEVSLAADAWVRRAASALERGWLLVVDYGDEEPDLWLRRPAGSLVTYRDEGLGVDPLADPGEADITAHVDFSALARAAREAGLEARPLVTQRDWLRSLGIEELASDLRVRQDSAERAGDHAEMVRLLADRGRLGALTARGGLGDLRVFIAEKPQARPS
ncbi:MAG TPA: SAM-dependent methyltransferase [Actinomycetota bacterium]|nr:SAM-dependent methyltransferase [Actinomycetota bacterium]